VVIDVKVVVFGTGGVDVDWKGWIELSWGDANVYTLDCGDGGLHFG
jgi:hypothetical protein